MVYPNNPSANPRQNPRGAYYENLIISAQGEAAGRRPGQPRRQPCAARSSTAAPSAATAPWLTDWYTKIGALTWDGNQTVYDGAVISIFVPSAGRNAFPATYSATTAPSIDGFDLRGGDQQGFPGNINEIGGGPTGLPAGLVTQGGAIFANAYARNLQITNNVVQNNGGTYGTIRIGTPDLPAPDTNNHNEDVRIAQQPDHRQRRHQPGRRCRPLRRRRQLRGRRQRHLRQLLGRVRRRPRPSTASARTAPIHRQPDLLQPVVRRGRRDHGRRRAAGRPRDRSRRAPARSTSTTT